MIAGILHDDEQRAARRIQEHVLHIVAERRTQPARTRGDSLAAGDKTRRVVDDAALAEATRQRLKRAHATQRARIVRDDAAVNVRRLPRQRVASAQAQTLCVAAFHRVQREFAATFGLDFAGQEHRLAKAADDLDNLTVRKHTCAPLKRIISSCGGASLSLESGVKRASDDGNAPLRAIARLATVTDATHMWHSSPLWAARIWRRSVFSRCYAATASARLPGNSTPAIKPPDGLFSSQTLPSCSATRPLTSARPSPVPPTLLS